MPPYLRPSALRWAALCRARFLGAHEDATDHLPPSLVAVRGSVRHQTRANLAAVPEEAGASPHDAALAAFLAARDEEQSNLSHDWWWSEYDDLAAHMPWDRERPSVLPMANELAKRPTTAPSPSPSPTKMGTSVVGRGSGDLLGPIPGLEVRVRSERLRVSGIVDEVRRSPSGLEVVEVKTTERAATDDGAELQSRTYALVLEELTGEQVTQVVLRGPGTWRLVSWDDSHRSATRSLLSQLLVEESSLARPGTEQCTGCPVRHRCEPYRRWLDDRRADGHIGANGGDLFGIVVAVSSRGSATANVKVRRPDGGSSLVRGVPERNAPETGDEIAVYGLATSGASRLNWSHPPPPALHQQATGQTSGLAAAWGVVWS